MPRKTQPAKDASSAPSQPRLSQPLQDCTVVVTGKIARKESSQIKEALEEAGAKVARDVTGKVSQVLVPKAEFVMCGKTGKAQAKSLPIVPFQWVWDCIVCIEAFGTARYSTEALLTMRLPLHRKRRSSCPNQTTPAFHAALSLKQETVMTFLLRPSALHIHHRHQRRELLALLTLPVRALLSRFAHVAKSSYSFMFSLV